MHRFAVLRVHGGLGAALLGAAALLGVTVCGARAVERSAVGWYLPIREPARPERGRLAVLVLGYADSGEVAGLCNRRRADAAVEVLRPGDTLITSGGAVAGPHSEAWLLAQRAAEQGWGGPTLLEEGSRSTWENIERSAPLLEPFDHVVIISDPLHAAKARRFLQRQRPDLAARLVTGGAAAKGLSSGTLGVIAGLIDLGLSEHVPGWARESAQGLEGLRRLAALAGRS